MRTNQSLPLAVIAALVLNAAVASAVIARGALAQAEPMATALSCASEGSGPPWVMITARLTAEGAPLADQRIEWTAGGRSGLIEDSSETDASGDATARFTVIYDGGDQGDVVVTATFAGNDSYASSSCEARFHAYGGTLPRPPAEP